MIDSTKLSHLLLEASSLSDPSAVEFIKLYHKYISAVDDYIDEDRRNSTKAEAVLDLMALAREVRSHPFWLAHRELWLLDILLENSYRDSERLKSEYPEAARVWSSCGELMIFAVIAIVEGKTKLDKVSTLIRAANYEQQKGDKEYGRKTRTR